MKSFMKMGIYLLILTGALCMTSCGEESCTEGVVTLRFTNNGDKSIDIDPSFSNAGWASLFNSSSLSNIASGETAQIGVDRSEWSSLGSNEDFANLTVVEHSVGTPLTTLTVNICDGSSDTREIDVSY